jgi:hypothetical protein
MSSGMLRRVALVRTDVSEEPNASFIRMTRIDELGTTLAVTSHRRTLRCLVWQEELGILIKLNSFIGFRTRKLPACTTVELLPHTDDHCFVS